MSMESSQSASLEDFGSMSTPSTLNKPQRVKLTKHARNLLKDTSKLAIRRTKDRREYEKKVCRNEAVRTITVAKLVALLRLALLLTDQGIYTSDIFRWIAEGHLSVHNCQVFLPKEAIVKGELKCIMQVAKVWSSFGQKSHMTHLCSLLAIHDIPVPNLCSLAVRYCTELQLPDDFTTAACYWLTVLPKNMFRPTTNYEAITMSVIFILLKMMFSLDGKTENNLSHLAKEVGRLSSSLDQQKLFVWNDWVQFIECRKLVVARHHFPTHMALYGELKAAAPEAFFSYQQYLKGRMADGEEDMAKIDSRGKGNKIWASEVKRWLEKVDTVDSCQHGLILFPPSLTPLYTYTKTLLEQYPDRLTRETKAILSQEFTKHSVQYAFDPERFVSNNADRGIKIIIHDEPSNNFDEVPVVKKKEIVARWAINKEILFVRVNVERKEKDEGSFNKSDCDIGGSGSTVLGDDEFISDDSSIDDDMDKNNMVVENDLGESRHVDLLPQIYKTENKKAYILNTASTKYWCHYLPLKKLSISNDDTESKSMALFPPSFLWLLRECARTINVTVRDLYMAVMRVEKICETLGKPQQTFKFNK